MLISETCKVWCIKNDSKARNWTFIKNPQFLYNQTDIQAILSTHGLVIFTKFHNDSVKIVDFSQITYFWIYCGFYASHLKSIKLVYTHGDNNLSIPILAYYAKHLLNSKQAYTVHISIFECGTELVFEKEESRKVD